MHVKFDNIKRRELVDLTNLLWNCSEFGTKLTINKRVLWLTTGGLGIIKVQIDKQPEKDSCYSSEDLWRFINWWFEGD